MLNYQRVRRMFLWNKYPTAENLHQVVQALAETNSAERLRENAKHPTSGLPEWPWHGAWIFTWIEFIYTLTIGIQIVTALTYRTTPRTTMNNAAGEKFANQQILSTPHLSYPHP